MAIPAIVKAVALGGGTLALLLIGKKASAATNGGGGGGGGVPVPGPPNRGGGGGGTIPFPPGSSVVRVNVTTGEGGLILQPAPRATGPSTAIENLSNGSQLMVLRAGIPETGAPADALMEWWEVRTPRGAQGFVRAVGPRGESNLTPVSGPLPAQVVVGPIAPSGPNGLPPPVVAGMRPVFDAMGQCCGYQPWNYPFPGFSAYPFGYGPALAPYGAGWDIMGRRR